MIPTRVAFLSLFFIHCLAGNWESGSPQNNPSQDNTLRYHHHHELSTPISHSLLQRGSSRVIQCDECVDTACCPEQGCCPLNQPACCSNSLGEFICCAAASPTCCGINKCCDTGFYCCRPTDVNSPCCPGWFSVSNVTTNGIHLSPFTVTIQHSPNWKAIALLLYYFPNSNTQSLPPAPQANATFLRTLYFNQNAPPLNNRTSSINITQPLLLLDERLGTVATQAIGGFLVMEALGNEYPGLGIANTVARTQPFRVLDCADCEFNYNVLYVTCSVITLCSPTNPSGCSTEDQCDAFITPQGTLQNANALVVREGQQVTLFRQFERVISLIVHNQEGFIIVRPDSAEERLQVEHHTIGDCTRATFCASYFNFTDISGDFASLETFYVVVQATPIQ